LLAAEVEYIGLENNWKFNTMTAVEEGSLREMRKQLFLVRSQRHAGYLSYAKEKQYTCRKYYEDQIRISGAIKRT
jgi:hypothetical protein